LEKLAAHSSLPTLSDLRRLERYLREEHVFGAVLEDSLVGCCCLEKDVRKEYVSPSGKAWFPLPNVCFCGAFVLPRYRGRGVGLTLYRHRLEFSQANYRLPTIVELLGDGTPSSVDPDTAVGYEFYRRNGFSELGYSIDVDAGKILWLPSPDMRKGLLSGADSVVKGF